MNAKKALLSKIGFIITLARQNFVRARLPYKAMLLVTWRCQARCRMCNIWQKAPEREFTIDEWSLFFQRNPYLEWLTLSGGEPFLRPDIVEIVRLALDHCPKLCLLNMPTNGLAAEMIEKSVTRILALGVPKFALSISIDGPEEVHDKVRGIPGAWRRAIALLAWAKKKEQDNRSRFSVMLEHTLMPDSYGRFGEMLSQVQSSVPEVQATDIMVTIGSVSGHYYGNTSNEGLYSTVEAPRALESALREIMDLRRGKFSLQPLNFFTRFFLNMAVRYARGGVPPMRCRAARSSVFIDPCGLVYPCNSFTRLLGSLRDNDYSIEKIFAGNDMAKVRADIDGLKCGGCWTACEASLSVAESIMNPVWAWRIIKNGLFH